MSHFMLTFGKNDSRELTISLCNLVCQPADREVPNRAVKASHFGNRREMRVTDIVQREKL